MKLFLLPKIPDFPEKHSHDIRGQCAADYVGYAVWHLFQSVAEHKYSAIGKAHSGKRAILVVEKVSEQIRLVTI